MSEISNKKAWSSGARGARRILSPVVLALLTGAVILMAGIGLAKDGGPVIIDPKLSAYGALPLHPYDRSKGVPIEGKNPFDPSRPLRGVRYDPDALWPPGGPPARPSGLLIRGKVSDPSKRWVAVMARDEQDLRERLATYRALRDSGDWIQALQLLRLIDVNVATSVTAYRGREKLRDMPEKVGTFFLTIPMIALDRCGWFIALLPHTPLPAGDIGDYGSDLGEHVGGMLKVEELPSGKDYVYRMKILEVELSDESLREQHYSVHYR